jgi:hypothetical protein
VVSVFSSAPSDLAGDRLLAALNYTGSGDANRILLRAAVAALLNAAHPGVDYPLSVSAIVSRVNSALASPSRGQKTSLAAQLDGYNNLSSECPAN